LGFEAMTLSFRNTRWRNAPAVFPRTECGDPGETARHHPALQP
jgi:hypothetical protein